MRFNSNKTKDFSEVKFPDNYIYGPLCAPENLSEFNESDVFDMYFTDVISHLSEKTKQRFILQNIKSKIFNKSTLSITNEKMLKYLTCHIAIGLLHTPNNKETWSNPEDSYFLLGNSFVKKLCLCKPIPRLIDI